MNENIAINFLPPEQRRGSLHYLSSDSSCLYLTANNGSVKSIAFSDLFEGLQTKSPISVSTFLRFDDELLENYQVTHTIMNINSKAMLFYGEKGGFLTFFDKGNEENFRFYNLIDLAKSSFSIFIVFLQ